MITSLLVGWSFALLCIAALAYPVFYYTYVPKQIVSVPVHLQYNAALNPYGFTYFSRDLMLETAYDVFVDLSLPRSPPNLERGNFMVALFASSQAPHNPAHSWDTPGDPYKLISGNDIIFSSRRQALIPYSDPMVSTVSRLLFMVWHIFVPTFDRVNLHIPMGKLIEFTDQLPLSILLDVQAGQTLQVYSAQVELVARLRGLRWFMYNYRFISFVVCTTLFWIAEMLSMTFAWLMLSYCLSFRRQPRPVSAAPANQNTAGAGSGSGGGAVAVDGAAGGKHDSAAVKREGEGKAGTDGIRPGSATATSPGRSTGRGSGSASAGSAHSGGLSGVRVKDEDVDDVKIKEETVDGSTLVDALKHETDVDDGDEGQGTGAYYVAEGNGLRRRPSQI